MTVQERLNTLKEREAEVNQSRAVVQARIEEFQRRSSELEKELTNAGIDISDPEKSLRLLREQVSVALDDAEASINKTEGDLHSIEEKIKIIVK